MKYASAKRNKDVSEENVLRVTGEELREYRSRFSRRFLKLAVRVMILFNPTRMLVSRSKLKSSSSSSVFIYT